MVRASVSTSVEKRRGWALLVSGSAFVVASLAVLAIALVRGLPWRDGLNLTALLLSVGGLWVGVYQLVLAARAVKEASGAAESTRQYMVSTQQFDLLHKSRGIESKLESASQQGSGVLIQAALADWRQTASELSGLAEAVDGSGDLERALRESAVTARKVADAIREGKGDPRQLGFQALRRVSAVCDKLSHRIGLMKGMKREGHGNS